MSKLQQILAILATMTLREFAEFVRKFQITNYALSDILESVEKVQFPMYESSFSTLHSVVLYASGMNGKFIQTIKLYREHFSVGLKESKDAVDALRNASNQNNRLVILERIPLYLCENLAAHWRELGVDVTVLSSTAIVAPVQPLAPQYDDDDNNPW